MRALLVIDLQKEFKDNNGEYDRLLKFIERTRSNYDCIIATLFVNKDNDKFETELCFDKCKSADKNSLQFKYDCKFSKNTYALDVEHYLPKNIEYDVIGCDADGCIMATCFRMWDAGYRFKVIENMVYTNGDKINISQVRLQLRRQFGDSVAITLDV